jgi:hypothetical protein
MEPCARCACHSVSVLTAYSCIAETTMAADQYIIRFNMMKLAATAEENLNFPAYTNAYPADSIAPAEIARKKPTRSKRDWLDHGIKLREKRPKKRDHCPIAQGLELTRPEAELLRLLPAGSITVLRALFPRSHVAQRCLPEDVLRWTRAFRRPALQRPSPALQRPSPAIRREHGSSAVAGRQRRLKVSTTSRL